MAAAFSAILLVLGIAFSGSALAAAVVESIVGTVLTRISATAGAPVAIGQRLLAGSTLLTGPRGLATLRFDDGQVMLLGSESEFRIEEYAFNLREPAADRFGFALLRGAIRSVSAQLTRRNPTAYRLRTAHVTVGIRGTDFMVVLANSSYLNVLDGVIDASNSGGTASFEAGATAVAANVDSLPTSIAAGALPAAVAGSFKTMSSFALRTEGTQSGTGSPAGANTERTPETSGGTTNRNPVTGIGSGNSTGPAGNPVAPEFGLPATGPGPGTGSHGPMGPVKP